MKRLRPGLKQIRAAPRIIDGLPPRIIDGLPQGVVSERRKIVEAGSYPVDHQIEN
jgi:hypothetical protein